MADQYQQNFANETDFVADTFADMQGAKAIDNPNGQSNGLDGFATGQENSGQELTVIAEGNVLKDLSGNIVGTLNEDGSYSINDNYAVDQVADDQEALLQSFENQMSTSGTILPPADPKPIVASADITESLKTEPISNSVTQPVAPNVNDGTEAKTAISTTTIKKEGDKAPVKAAKAKDVPVVKKEPRTTGAESKSPPLGSSKNPIRIIQQGNTFTSTQQLTEEQLSQIMQVVQQQHALKEAQEAGGSKTIYNSKTQTKIVYKVVNPASGGTKITMSEEKTGGSSWKLPKKRDRSMYDSDEMESDEELDKTVELTKKRAKTRSGLLWSYDNSSFINTP